MMNLTIDQSRCTRCGLCKAECPALAIELFPGEYPTESEGGSDRCIHCQHCMMICPAAALTIEGHSPENSLHPQPLPSPESLKSLMMMRRSHRRYLDENVDPATIADLLDAMKFVPTGVNRHQLHFTIIDDKEVMQQLRETVYAKLRAMLKIKPRPAEVQFFAHMLPMIAAKLDPIFRGAPHLIVASNPANAPCAATDPVIALSYFELLAQSKGLGTVWFGYFMIMLATFMPELRNILNIPEDHIVGYAMLFGKTRCAYQRPPQPPPITVNRIQTINKL